MKKRDKVIEVAAECFLQKGFAETSLEDIATASGVVKQTLYNYFSNKDDLFKAAVAHLIEVTRCEFHDEWIALNPEEFFSTIAKYQLKLLSDPKTTLFLHLLVKECRRFPELQHIYSESIPMPFVDFVAEFIERQTRIKSQTPHLSPFAVAWCFRAAITGFATLANLGAVFPYKLPSSEEYIEAVCFLFARLIESKPLFVELALPEPKQVAIDEFFRKYQGEIFSAEGKSNEQKRLSCLIAAIKLFSTVGYLDTNLDDVAELAQVAKQTIYSYFENKSGLYSVLSKVVIEGLQRSKIPAQDLALDNYIIEFLSAFMETSEQEWLSGYFRLIFGEAKAFPQPSGVLLLYVFCFGLPELTQKINGTLLLDDANSRLLALIFRSIMGAFVLFNHVYVIGENPYLNQASLCKILCVLADTAEKNRTHFRKAGSPAAGS